MAQSSGASCPSSIICCTPCYMLILCFIFFDWVQVVSSSYGRKYLPTLMMKKLARRHPQSKTFRSKLSITHHLLPPLLNVESYTSFLLTGCRLCCCHMAANIYWKALYTLQWDTNFYKKHMPFRNSAIQLWCYLSIQAQALQPVDDGSCNLSQIQSAKNPIYIL